MAKKDHYTIKQVESALIAIKGLLSLAADRLGCSRECVRQYTKRYAQLAKVRDEARSKLVDTAELALESAVIDKAGWAVCFTLKTLGKDRGYVERQEVKVEFVMLEAAKAAMQDFLAQNPKVRAKTIAPIYAEAFGVQESALIQ